MAAADPDTIAASFLEVYVNKFANARAELPELYADASVMSFEGKTAGGKEGITAMLAENPVPAGSAAVLTTTDVQPSCAPGALLVFTTADMVGAKVQQVFHLVPTEGGSYYIHNDVFRASGSEANPDNTMVEMGGDVGKAFVLHYIETFDSDKSLLASLYRENSMLTMEGKQFGTEAGGGVAAIIGHYGTLPATKHELATIDVHAVAPDKTVLLVFVTGKIMIEGSDNALLMAQTFLLVSTGEDGGYYIHNDIFRFNYG